MIPRICRADAPPGEKRLFRLLADGHEFRDWIVLHSLDLANHVKQVSGEADFVIIAPTLGIVVLEIKSHDFIKYDERGWWFGISTIPKARGPFNQASSAMHSIRKYLSDKMPELVNNIPFISGVIFSECSFAKDSPEWHSWQVIDKQSLRGIGLAPALRGMLVNACEHYRKCGFKWIHTSKLTPENAEVISSILRPRFEIFIKSSDRIDSLNLSAKTCTDQQLTLLDFFGDNDRVVVKGPAGTGKTLIAMEALRRHKIIQPDSTVAFFCFNKLLGDELRRECKSLGGSSAVGSFHRWMQSLIKSPRELDTSEFWETTLPNAVIDLLLSTSGTVDFLILDEAQDLFADRYLEIFDLLLKGGLKEGRYLFLGDFERQNIYGKTSSDPTLRLRNRVGPGLSFFNLNINCRNSAEISHYVEKLGRLKPGYSKTLREDSHLDPTLYFFGSFEESVSLLENTIREFKREGFRDDEIVILTPKSQGSSAHTLSERNPWKGLIKKFEIQGKRIRWNTVHGFKGLESPAIILTDIDNFSDTYSSDIFYVGASRALHRLAILAHKDTQKQIREII